MDKSLDIIAIGECLIELSTDKYFEESETFNLSFGGDVIATAVAAQKLASKVGLITAVGDDYFKDVIIHKLQNQGLDTSHIQVSSQKNGLYLAGRTEKKELITYRRRVAGTNLGSDGFDENYIKSAKAVYATGITQSLSMYSTELVKKIFETARQYDILTAYDPNYTSSFMSTYDTKEYLENIIDNIDVLFFSLKSDGDPLYGLSSVEKAINYFSGCGIKTIVIKSHQECGYYVYNGGKTEFCSFYDKEQKVHTMNAGDVFNGGFLSGIINGYSAIEAAQIAAKQAGIFIERGGLLKNMPGKDEIMR